MADAIELIAREVAAKMGDQIETRIEAATKAVSERLQTEVERRIDAAVSQASEIATSAALAAVPTSPPSQQIVVPGVPAQDVKTDAKDRAWRTLGQGLAVTVLVSIITAFGMAVSAPEFDLLTWDSWRAAATAGGTAAVMAITAYIQRLISPPKIERPSGPGTT